MAEPGGSPLASLAYVHRGTRAVQRMVEHAPSGGGLALWVHHTDVPDLPDLPHLPHVSATPDAPVAAAATLRYAAASAPAWTDGYTVFYRPAFVQLPLACQTAWVAHEVLHIALRHGPRFLALQARMGQADLQLFNVCADAIVNSALAHLAWLQLAPDAVRLEALLTTVLGRSQDAETALLDWDVERLYLAVDDRRADAPMHGMRSTRARSGSGSGNGSGSGSGSGNGDGKGKGNGGSEGDGAASGAREPSVQLNHRGQAQDPGSHAAEPRAGLHDGPRAALTRALARADAADLQPAAGGDGDPQDEAEAARSWAERLLRAHAGDGEQSMLRMLLADLPRLHTPWEQTLRVQLARGLTHKPGLSWSRPARSWLANQGRTVGGRRLPWEPGVSTARPVARLVVVVDVSASIEPALMARFAGEIEAISRRLEAALVLVVGDERVRHVQAFEPGCSDLRQLSFHGGGGTDFTPLLEEAQRHRPDITVVLTDLDGPARFRPRCPVIWAVPAAQRHAVAPFGRLLVLR